MNRRNFITAGLISALPIPSIGFAETKSSAKPKTLNELLVKIEQETQFLIKSKVESWGYTVIEGWPSWDQPETMYYGCGVVYPKLRLRSSKRFTVQFGHSITEQDIEMTESFPSEVAQKAIKYLSDVKDGINRVVFLQNIAEYKEEGKLYLGVHFDWVRKDNIKLRDRAHLKQLLSKYDA